MDTYSTEKRQVPQTGVSTAIHQMPYRASNAGCGQNYIMAGFLSFTAIAGTPQSRGRTGTISSTHPTGQMESIAGSEPSGADNNQPNIEANMNDEWTPEMGYWPEFIPCEDWPDDVDEAYEAHAVAVRNRQTHNPDYEGAE